MKHYIFYFILLVFSTSLVGQYSSYDWPESFPEQDSIRGTLSKYRTCFDVKRYHLSVYFDETTPEIFGSNIISFDCIADTDTIQLDLFENMAILEVNYQDQILSYNRFFNAFQIIGCGFKAGNSYQIEVKYKGIPKIAKNAPWDGGFTWSEDVKGRFWAGVSCEGLGASVWWPNKDHLSDNPDFGMKMDYYIMNPHLSIIGNGQFRGLSKEGDYYKHSWEITYPITNYNVSFYIGHYSFFEDTYYTSAGTPIQLNYYVLDYNLEKAKIHFQQVHEILAALELFFGPYPFIEDGYKLVEAPYLGMEHQSAIAYGNNFQRGYLGGRIPANQDWDYLIMHETGHEWWGNSISCTDHADMWIHEAMTTYSEALFVEAIYGKPAYTEYLLMQRPWIRNLDPIQGPLDVNFDGFKSSDIYYKGAWIYHTLRNLVDDDLLWKDMLLAFYEKYKYSKVTSAEIYQYFKEIFKFSNVNAFIEQYFFSTFVPKLSIIQQPVIYTDFLIYHYKFEEAHPDLQLPLKLRSCDRDIIIHPNNEWQELILPLDHCVTFEELLQHYLIEVELSFD